MRSQANNAVIIPAVQLIQIQEVQQGYISKAFFPFVYKLSKGHLSFARRTVPELPTGKYSLKISSERYYIVVVIPHHIAKLKIYQQCPIWINSSLTLSLIDDGV